MTGVRDQTCTVRVVLGHRDLGDDTYHEWVNLGERVRADRNGNGNYRIWSTAWAKWVCNNPNCSAFAFVGDDGIRDLLDEAAGLPNGRLLRGGGRG